MILLLGITLVGCQTPFRSSGIDPTGQSVFADPAYTQPATAPGNVVVCPPACPPTTTCPPGQPVATLEPYAPPATAIRRQNGNGMPMPAGSQLAAGQPASTGPIMGALSGGYLEYPGRMLPWDNAQVIVSPCRTIAPVGSEVVLLAGVRGQDQYLRTNERVEWNISPGGVGEFVDYDKGLWRDYFLGDWTFPGKVSPTIAVTSTSRQYLRLSRETPTPDDDINVLRGQTWVTVTAAAEGISRVTAFAPSVYGWHARRQTVTIHWVDAQWKLPSPSFVTAGARQNLTTVVSRHTDGAPCVGWKVIYEVLGSGSSAGFAPNGACRATAITDECGRATVELAQSQAVSETTNINIRVIRPARVEGAAGKDLPVGGGSTSVTWTSSELTVRKTGPSTVGVDQPVVYRIDISNPGALATEGVVVTDEIPAGLQYEDSTPPAELLGEKLRWSLGTLAPRGSSSIEVRLKATRPGSVTSCAEATTSGALKKRDCVTTTIGQAAIEVQMLGPQQVYVGDTVDFRMVISNRGQAAATGLSIVDRFDPGLEHLQLQKSPIERDLGTIQPGNAKNIGSQFRANRPGNLCHTVEVLDSGNKILATGRKCVNVIARPSSTPPPATTPPATLPTSPPTQKPDAFKVWRKCPTTAKVGELIKCDIFISNTGNTPLTGVQVVENFNANLYPTQATDGHKYGTNRLTWMLPSIRPGITEHFTVHYRCEVETAKTCCSVDVRTSLGKTQRAESCLQINRNFTQPPTGTGTGTPGTSTPGTQLSGRLTVKVNGNRNPANIGSRILYTIDIQNESSTPDYNLAVTVTVPPEMKPRLTGHFDPNNNSPTPNGQEIRFAELAEIRPGETLTYRVAVDAMKTGLGVLRVKVQSKNNLQAMFEQAETEIKAP